MKVSGTTRRLLAQRRTTRERRNTASVQRSALAREQGPVRLRRWEAADTNRLNRSHWSNVFGRTINEDLQERLETLRIRCEHEVANDPTVKGIVETFANDVVGMEGPRLQVHSDYGRYNDLVEQCYEEYCRRPDSTIDATLCDTLKLDVRSLFSAGEYIHQFSSTRREGPFEFAIRSPHPRRLSTRPENEGSDEWFMGVQVSADRGITAYDFRDEPPGRYARMSFRWSRKEAANIQHKFIRYEQDQLRGFPWLSVSLNDIADMRDLDKFVLEAAKNAAAQGVYWWTQHPEAMIEFQVVNETRKIEPGMEQVGPPGYQPAMLAPTQPSAQYKEFRHEKMRGYGRPIGMPLMMVLLSSEGNSFSGANHDGQIYIRSVQGTQAWMASGTLNPQVDQISQEVINVTGIRRPRRVQYVWTWMLPPHPDPRKNYEALRMQLEDGSMSLMDVCAALGRDFDTVQAARAYVNEQLDALKLPRPPINVGNLKRTTDNSDTTSDGEANDQNPRPAKRAALQPA